MPPAARAHAYRESPQHRTFLSHYETTPIMFSLPSGPLDKTPQGKHLKTLAAGLLVMLVIMGVIIMRTQSNTGGVDVAITTVTPPALAVIAVSARIQTWPQIIRANGVIAGWDEARVAASIDGLRLTALLANVGDRVKKDQVLARLDDEMLQAEAVELQAQLQQATASLAQAKAHSQRILRLKDSGATYPQEILQYVTQTDIARAQVASAQAQLEIKRVALRQTFIRSPDDGVVSMRDATLGGVLPVGHVLFRVIRQQRLEWRGELTAEQLARVTAGQRVTLTLPGGDTAAARIRQISPAMDNATRLGTVYADIDIGGPARLGMYTPGEIELSPAPALVIPASSIFIRDGRSMVASLGRDPSVVKVKLKVVQTGRRLGDRVEAVAGIDEGERLVLQGGAFLGDGDTVRLTSPDNISFRSLP